jgi:hypothetical protein
LGVLSAAFAVLIAEELFASGCQLDQRDFGGSDRAGAGYTVLRCH